MTDMIEIPTETARAIAAWLWDRIDDEQSITSRLEMRRIADLLDPRPTLRDAVAKAMHATGETALPDAWILWVDAADAALAVVRDRVAALDMSDPYGWRRAVLALLDEGATS